MPDLKLSGLAVDAAPALSDYVETLDASDTTMGPYGTNKRVTLASLLTIRGNAAPADASLAAGELAFWFDPTDGAGKLMVKAKTANGTIVAGSVPLA